MLTEPRNDHQRADDEIGGQAEANDEKADPAALQRSGQSVVAGKVDHAARGQASQRRHSRTAHHAKQRGAAQPIPVSQQREMNIEGHDQRGDQRQRQQQDGRKRPYRGHVHVRCDADAATEALGVPGELGLGDAEAKEKREDSDVVPLYCARKER